MSFFSYACANLYEVGGIIFDFVDYFAIRTDVVFFGTSGGIE